ncbi:GNAT family N-acetyltransferase [Altererythrobacter soli]|uniref:GNAT family N-acetyltransferase n=1 Tax=Croceibacterium soli TaxID=1739690 RepID=A0A6I4UU18_9SPHN|nr:GNAT family N-acetyltransferase [Croceibacterium soli]MXP42410.1 GNAT family N-acetyltransferase [Croceibacterium soli]
MTATSYHASVKDVQARPSPALGPFARLEWFALLEGREAEPIHAVAQDASGAVILPLRRKGRRLESLLNWYAFTWRPLATAYASLDSLTIALARDLRRKASHIVLDRVPDEDGSARQLERAFRRAGWVVARETCDTNSFLAVEGRSYSEYLADRPGSLRTTLKRKAKKVDVAILTAFDSDAWGAYEAIYAESWKPEEGDPDMLRAFAEAEGTAGRIRLAIARHEGEPVAAQFWTVEGGTAYIHKLAYRESAKALSAGTTLTAALLERVIDGDGVTLVDFGTGDDPYKRDWMEQARPRYRLQCWRKGDPRNWPAIARSRLRALVSRGERG